MSKPYHAMSPTEKLLTPRGLGEALREATRPKFLPPVALPDEPLGGEDEDYFKPRFRAETGSCSGLGETARERNQ